MSQTPTPDLGTRRELFLDDTLIDTLTDARLTLHQPRPAGVALALDRPWEGPFCGYCTVMTDGERYWMTYRGWMAVEQGAAPQFTCLATSDDGIHWDKPDLGLVEIDGSTHNNVILHERDHGDVCHNFAPFVDARPGVPADERFKALGGSWRKTGGLRPYASADGVHWRSLSDAPVVTHPTFGFDSQNVAFWSQAEGRYVCFYRYFTGGEGGFRWVYRQSSDDFLHWGEATEMRSLGGPIEQIYIQQTTPYYRAPHHYIATAARFNPGRTAITAEEAAAAGMDDRYWHDTSDAVLMTARAGGDAYYRTFMESWIRPGPGPEHWGSRSNYPARGVVPTGAHEMSVYIMRRYAQEGGYIERLTLRPDGFISVNAGYGGGEMVTVPLRFAGEQLAINLATGAAGGVRVELQDVGGEPIAGFTLEEADELIGDALDRVVTWRGGQRDLGALAGRAVRVRFVMRDADLYAMRFA